MLPIVSIFDLINAVVGAAVAVRVFTIYRRSRNEVTKYFLLFYLAFTLLWLCWAMPGLLVSNPSAMAITNMVGFLFLYASMVAIVPVAFSFIDRREWGAIVGALVATAGVVFLLGRLLDLRPAIKEIIGGYVYWRTDIADWLRLLTGVTGLAVALMCTGTFAYLGWRDRANNIVFRRSMYLAAGMSSITIAAVFSFFLYLVIGSFWGNFLASVLVIIGLLLMLSGMVGQPRPVTASATPR